MYFPHHISITSIFFHQLCLTLFFKRSHPDLLRPPVPFMLTPPPFSNSRVWGVPALLFGSHLAVSGERIHAKKCIHRLIVEECFNPKRSCFGPLCRYVPKS